MLRDNLKQAQIAAMKAGEKDRLAAVRLILAKVKDRDIEERGKHAQSEGRSTTYDKDLNPIAPKPYAAPASDDALIVEVLQKMAKQRRESIEMYESGGRQELADVEKGELAVIEEFLPQQMSEAETKAAIEAIKSDLGAAGMKDMGRVMAELKARHGPQLDMGRASGWVKESLQ
jgi:uncharacterized protein